ncbi:potential mitochondrial protein [Pseudozyma hubeiensis SY62]|uniref:Potential mitochondrial protein n=1 Tax=Pseudozyma hubeiensis (strain SY62) TaxID=1305764 RepID=R9PAM2_PSEHS|nr:potential mitochondrial protein [Pseudozyma hubeiensis SY62]GAC95145.1 potential mitochondrial protein [Pseudozyma hubeiensis SY62]
MTFVLGFAELLTDALAHASPPLTYRQRDTQDKTARQTRNSFSAYDSAESSKRAQVKRDHFEVPYFYIRNLSGIVARPDAGRRNKLRVLEWDRGSLRMLRSIDYLRRLSQGTRSPLNRSSASSSLARRSQVRFLRTRAPQLLAIKMPTTHAPTFSAAGESISSGTTTPELSKQQQQRQASVLTTQTAPASPALRATLTPDAAAVPASASDSALVSSNSPIKAAAVAVPVSYVAPPIPSSIKTSFAAWWKANPVQDAAHAELHLYRSTGYFDGASVNNVICENEELRDGKGLANGLEWAQRASSADHVVDNNHASSSSIGSLFHAPKFWPFHRSKEPSTMTIGLTPAADGKIGCIRLVDLGSADTVTSTPSKSLPGSANASLTSSPAVKSTAGSNLPVPADAPLDEPILNDNLELTPTPQDGVKPYTPPSGRKLNMLEIGIPYSKEKEQQIKSETKIVLAHGYGAGSAFFFQNIKSMAQIPDSRLYVLDWLGMGRSSRPTFHIPSSETKNVESRVAAAESFFISSLEDWRAKMGLEKMVLVGHSLGGYLSLAYALRYPSRVERLVLVSPVGIPTAPPEDEAAAANTFKPKNRSAVEEEMRQPQENVAPKSAAQELKDTSTANDMARKAAQNRAGGIIEGNSGGASSAGQPLARSETMQTVDSAKVPRSGQSSQPEKGSHEPPRFSKRMRSVFGYLWEQNVSPFGILRGSLFFGPMMAGRYTSRRFGALPDDELRSLHAYCQSIFLSKGSGEYCLAHILAPGAYARRPMVDRIERLKMPMSFLYGEHDWMDVRGGKEAVKRLRKQGNSKTNCFVVPNSGHHIYLDNPSPYNSLIARILRGEADSSSK